MGRPRELRTRHNMGNYIGEVQQSCEPVETYSARLSSQLTVSFQRCPFMYITFARVHFWGKAAILWTIANLINLSPQSGYEIANRFRQVT